MTPRKIGQKPPTLCRLAHIAVLAVVVLALGTLVALMRLAFQK